MKKKLIPLLAALSAIFLLGSCSSLEDVASKLPFFPNDSVESSSVVEGDESSKTPEENDSSSTTTPPADDSCLQVLIDAYTLADGETLKGQTLTGTITEINQTSEGDVCLTMVACNCGKHPIYCYWLQDADFVKVGDTITVTGDIKNYGGLIEFFKPTLVDNSSSGGGNSSGGEVDTSDALSVLKAAYALSDGETLTSQTLTGTITNIKKVDQGDVCLTIVVGNYTDYPMYCYWLQDADHVKVGDTITVTGDIKNYGGLIEFFKPTLVDNSSSGGNSGGSTSHLYTDFTTSEKALFNEYFGEVIPFIANSTYEVEEYTTTYEDGTTEIGLNFYTEGNTQAEFNAYLATLEGIYTAAGEDVDEYGDTWYFFDSDNYYIDVAYYFDGESIYYVDLYVYVYDEEGTSGSGGSSSNTDVNLITNEGKGLPSGVNGVHNIDFTDATYVKNVTEQGYYLDGCPTTGSPAVLVVPVEFSDVTAASKGYSIDAIKKAFNGGASDTDYYSVHDYYFTSSYGKLDLDITVLDTWFRPQYASTYYENAKMDYYGSQVDCGEQIIIDEILASLEGTMDLSKFDSDGNTVIDAIVLINTLDIDSDKDFYWAYRYWNLYTDDDGYYYEYDGVSANDYLWAPYQFLHESYDDEGYAIYDDTSVMNTYTYIHEFGHVLGADDYYDTSYVGEPMGGCDIMDTMMGDHNAFTKFNFGWLTSSRLVVAEDSVTLTLEEFGKNGDTIIIANNWDDTLGAYQEYYILAYYTNSGLNDGDYGYFDRDGIVVYHVNASLCADDSYDELYYDIYNNNTDASDSYGTEDNLIEYVKSANDTYTYIEGDTMSSTKDDNGNVLQYNFVVDSFADGVATITFTKN